MVAKLIVNILPSLANIYSTRHAFHNDTLSLVHRRLHDLSVSPESGRVRSRIGSHKVLDPLLNSDTETYCIPYYSLILILDRILSCIESTLGSAPFKVGSTSMSNSIDATLPDRKCIYQGSHSSHHSVRFLHQSYIHISALIFCIQRWLSTYV